MLSRFEAPFGRVVPATLVALGLALGLGLTGCGSSANMTPRVLDDPPPPDPGEMSSDNMPDPRTIQALHDDADQTP